MSLAEHTSPPRILLVNEDTAALQAHVDYLRRRFAIFTAREGGAALEMIEREPAFAVLVSSLDLPDMNGVELCTEAQRMSPELVSILLNGAPEPMASGAEMEIFQTLPKNCPPPILASALGAAVKQHHLLVAERELLERTLNGSIRVLSEVLASLDPKSFGEAQNIKEYMRVMTAALRVRTAWELEIAAMLCHVGYVTLPATLIQKVQAGLPLTAVERQLVNRTPEFGHNLLASIPRLESVARAIYYQHKNYDGTGFPDDTVAGEQIPKGARILRILCDLVRREAEGLSRSAALDQMLQNKGLYDLRLLQLAQKCLLHNAPKSGRPVNLSELETGQVLTAPVETKDGLLIVAAGTRISCVLLEKLQHFTQLSGVREPIYIEQP